MVRQRPEQSLHIAVANYLALALDPSIPWTTIGHGGGGAVRGAILKAMGVKPGWPDIIIFTHPVIFLELKSSVGTTSPDQKIVFAALRARGAHVHICRSCDDVQVVLEREGLTLKAKLA